MTEVPINVSARCDTERSKHIVLRIRFICYVLYWNLNLPTSIIIIINICRTWLYISTTSTKTAFAYSYIYGCRTLLSGNVRPACLRYTSRTSNCSVYSITLCTTRHHRFKETYIYIECGTSDSTKRPTDRQPLLLGTCSNAHFIDVQRQHEQSVISIILMWRHDAACVCVFILCFPTSTSPNNHIVHTELIDMYTEQ